MDNFDSYTHNLLHLVAAVTGVEPIVIKNTDAEKYAVLKRDNEFDLVVISPGPGRPEREADFGICKNILEQAERPVFGVCLGCQGLGWIHGGGRLKVNLNPDGPAHGRIDPVYHSGHRLFQNLPQGLNVVRYHSLSLCNDDGSWPDFPEHLEPIAWTKDRIVMAIGHKRLPLWGVQFHPESVCSERGFALVQNFVSLAQTWYETEGSTLMRVGRSSCVPKECVDRPLTGCPPLSRVESPTGPPPSRALSIRFRKLSCSVDPEWVYLSLLRDDVHAFWLDSSRRPHPNSRFSYMGPSSGPLCKRLVYTVSRKELLVLSHGATRSTLHNVDLFDYLKADLHAAYCDCPELPLDFKGGYVGFLGYELKSICDDGLHGPNKYQAPHPDAQLLFADRLIAFDHVEGCIYLVCVLDGLCEASVKQSEFWLTSTHKLLQQHACEYLSPDGSVVGSAQQECKRRGVGRLVDQSAQAEGGDHGERVAGLEGVEVDRVLFHQGEEVYRVEEAPGGRGPDGTGVEGAEEDRTAPDDGPSGPGNFAMAPSPPCAPSGALPAHSILLATVPCVAVQCVAVQCVPVLVHCCGEGKLGRTCRAGRRESGPSRISANVRGVGVGIRRCGAGGGTQGCAVLGRRPAARVTILSQPRQESTRQARLQWQHVRRSRRRPCALQPDFGPLRCVAAG